LSRGSAAGTLTLTSSELFENLGLAALELMAGVARQQAGAAAGSCLGVDRLAPRVRALQTHGAFSESGDFPVFKNRLRCRALDTVIYLRMTAKFVLVNWHLTGSIGSNSYEHGMAVAAIVSSDVFFRKTSQECKSNN
jgi:hypothetical protein